MKKIFNAIIILAITLLGVVLISEYKKPEPVEEVVVIEKPEEDRIETITMVSIGDIMYHSTQILENTSRPSGYDFVDSMALTKPYFKNADITIGNYETTTTKTKAYTGYPQFNTPVESLDAIKDAGFDILSTINNHTLDSGKQGLIDTYNAIQTRGMIPIGTRPTPQPSLRSIERKGIKLGFLAYTYGFNGLDFYLTEEQHQYMVSSIDEEKIESEIKSSVAANNDLTVVMMHWGNEYQTKPSDTQRDLAHKMVDWGADVILGSHPHVVQEHEMINDAFVIYSMGNYVSDQRLETLGDINTERGLLIEFTFEKNFTSNITKIKEIDYHPLWVNKYYKEDRYFYEAIPAKDFLDGKIDPYVPDGSRARIQAAYDETLKRVQGLD
ncbi:MAG: CapA family protein [Erysipelothrix sp.]|nr:CapA family protein [Erysipelothrix sp.]